jgi:hypothetical protein
MALNTGSNPFKGKNDPARLAQQRERQRGRPNRGGGGGGRPGGMGGGKGKGKKKGNGNTDVTTPEPTTAFAAEDPQSWFQGALQQSGFNTDLATGHGQFLNDMIGGQFAQGFNTFQTNPANAGKTLWDYVRGQNMGVPEPYLGGQPGGDWAAFQAWIRSQMDRYSPQQQGLFDQGKQPGSVRYNYFT